MSHVDGAVTIPRLTTRSALVWFFGTMLVTAGILGYLAYTQPENRWTLWVLVPVMVVPIVVGVSRRTWLDTTDGTIRWQWLAWHKRAVRLADLRDLDLVTDRGGGLQLKVRDEGRAHHIPVLALTDYVEKSLPPEVLETLADQITQRTPSKVAKDVPGLLRKQAKHLRAGGDAKTSPLAARVSHTMSRLAKGGGAVGGGSGLVP